MTVTTGVFKFSVMDRIHLPKSLLLLVALLLPLQGVAGMVALTAPHPCPQEQPHSLEQHHAMGMAEMAQQTQAQDAPCPADCFDCTGCAHAPSAMLLFSAMSQPWSVPASWGSSSANPYRSVTLFSDPPPPRFTNAA